MSSTDLVERSVVAQVERADEQEHAITTTLFSTGAHAAAKKRRRALSSAVPRAISAVEEDLRARTAALRVMPTRRKAAGSTPGPALVP